MQKFCAIILLTGLVVNNEGFPQTKWSRQISDTEKEVTRERRQYSFGEWIPLSKPFLDPVQVGHKKEDIGLTPPRPPVTRQIHGDGIFYSQDDSAILSVPPPPPGGIQTHTVTGSNSNFRNLPIQNLGTFSSPLPLPTQQSFPQTSQIQFLPRPFVSNQNLAPNSNQQILPGTQGVVFGPVNSGGPQFIQKEKVPKLDSNFSQQKFNKEVVLEQNTRPAENFPNAFPSKPPHFASQQTLLQQTLPETFVQQQPVVRHQQAATFEKSILTPPPVSNTTAQDVRGFGKEEIQLLYVPVETLKQRGTYLQQQQQQRLQLQSLNQQHQSLNQQQQSLNQQQQSINQQNQQKAQQQQALDQQNQSLKQQQLSLNQQLQSLKQQQQALNQQKDQQKSFNKFQQEQLRPILVQQQQLIDRQHEQKTQQQQLIDQQHQQQTQQQVLLNQQKEQQIQQQESLNQRQQQLNVQQKRLQQNIEFQSRPITDPKLGNGISPTEPTTTSQLPKGHFIMQNGGNQEQALRTVKIPSHIPLSPVSTASTLFFQTLPFQVTPHSFVSATPISSTPATFETSPAFPQKLFTPTPETTLSHLSTLQNTIPNGQSKHQFATTPKSVVTEESLPEEIITGRPQYQNFQNQKFHQQSVDFVFDQPQQSTGNVQHQSFVNKNHKTEKQSNRNKGYITEQQGTGVVNDKPKQQWQDQQQFTLETTQDQLNFLQQKREKELLEQYLLKQLQQEESEKQRLAEEQKQKELAEQRLLQKQERQKKLEEQRRKEIEEQKRQKELQEQRLLQLQRQAEAEQARVLLELEEQRKFQKLKEAEEIRLALEKEEKRKEKPLLRWQKQQSKLENQRLLQQQQQREFDENSSIREQQNEKQRVLQQQQQQQRQNNFEGQNSFQREQNEKQLEGHRASQEQIQNYYEGQNAFQQQQKEQQLEDQRVLLQERQQQRQNNFDEQNSYQQDKNEKQLEDKRIVQQQRQQYQQNDFEDQRLLKEQQSEDRRVLQQQQQQHRQNNLEGQNSFQQEQNDKKLERQRTLQQQRQNYYEGQNSFQQQQKEKQEQQGQQNQQSNFERQRELKEQQSEERRQLKQEHLEDRQRLLREQQLQKQKEENYRNLQKFYQPQSSGQSDDYFFSGTDKAKSQSEVGKKPETESLVPHQPPLSVFYKGYEKSKSRIFDVLRDLRNSKTITVLDQYFETMPKVFVGPAALTPPDGYDKFDLPYLSNIESNVVLKKIDNLPFFVAPLNFVPPSGYSKIPFPSPHVGSVVVSDESNPAVTDKSTGTEIEEDSNYSIVGPELPGLINGLDAGKTTVKSTTSLPQTTAQLRNRRPTSNLFRGRRPVSRTRSTTTTIKPEEVTRQSQREEDGVFGRPFNRFVKRRRQQVKSTTETSVKPQIENEAPQSRHYSAQVNYQSRNNFSTQKQYSQIAERNRNGNQGFDRTGSVNRNELRVRPTGSTTSTSFFKRPENDDSDKFETDEEGPLPTGSSKTITLELYRPNDLRTKTDQGLSDGRENVKLQPSKGEKAQEISKQVSAESNANEKYLKSSEETETGGKITAATESEKEQTPEGASQKYLHPTDYPETNNPQTTPDTIDNVALNNAYTAAFAEISKSYHIPRPKEFTDKYENKYSEVNPILKLSQELETPLPERHQELETPLPERHQELETPVPERSQELETSLPERPQEFSGIGDGKSPQAINHSSEFSSTGSYIVEDPASVLDTSKNQQNSNDYGSDSEINPNSHSSDGYLAKTEIALQSATNAPKQHATESDNLENHEFTPIDDHQNFQYYLSSTEKPTPEYATTTEKGGNEDAFREYKENHSSTTTERELEEVDEEFSGKKSGGTQRTHDQGQDVDRETFANNRRQKFSNPSRIRTRVRGRQRGQINYATSQTSTPPPTEKFKLEHRQEEDDDQETSTNSYKNERHRVKSSRYNFRVVKKPLRPTPETTTETTAENDQKHNVYTIRPHRRPTTISSTLSTKRIRRPTTPSPTEESSTEFHATFTPEIYPATDEEAKFSASGVSNDVYNENGRFSSGRPIFQKSYDVASTYRPPTAASVRRKFQQPYDSEEEERTDFRLTSRLPTAPYPTVETYHSAPDDYPSNGKTGESTFPRESGDEEYFEVYPQWRRHPEIESAGSVSTTVRLKNQNESEEEKRFQESKKAFDPDLGKKTGRRRIRVRVHKRPHESFETAESQNLRTVANVLVQPTSTYKPSDENQFQLAKNLEPSQKRGEQKTYQFRNKNYFETRFNLTRHDLDRPGSVQQILRTDGKPHPTDGEVGKPESESERYSGNVQKKEKEFTTSDLNEKNFLEVDGRKVSRTKLKGYVRKVIKHRIPVEQREGDEKSNQSPEDGNVVSISSPEGGVHHGGFDQTRILNGTRHKTIIRYIKKNKVRNHETDVQKQSEDSESRGTTEILENQQGSEESESQLDKQQEQQQQAVTEEASKFEANLHSVYATTAQPEVQQTEEFNLSETQPAISTNEMPEPTESTLTFTTENDHQTEFTFIPSTEESKTETDSTKPFPVFRETSDEPEETHSTKSTEVTTVKTNEGRLPYKPRFRQRPAYQRPPYSGFNRAKLTVSPSTTESYETEHTGRRFRPSKSKYGKVTSSYGSNSEAKTEDSNREHNFGRQKTNGYYNFDVRKYSSNRNREVGLSQYSRNRYSTSEKTEIPTTTSEEKTEYQTSKATTTSPLMETTTSKLETDATTKTEKYSATEFDFKTTRKFDETTPSDEEDSEFIFTTTEEPEILTLEEEDSSEINYDLTTTPKFETTTEETTDSSIATEPYTSGFKTTYDSPVTTKLYSSRFETTHESAGTTKSHAFGFGMTHDLPTTTTLQTSGFKTTYDSSATTNLHSSRFQTTQDLPGSTKYPTSGFETTHDLPGSTMFHASGFETTQDLPGSTKFQTSGFETTHDSPTTTTYQTSGSKTTHDSPGTTITLQTSGQTKTPELPATRTETSWGTNVAESTENSSPEVGATESYEADIQPDLYRFAKNSFSFDESENFAGTQNRAYVRNITADIIESTSSFSAPGIEQRNEIQEPKDESLSAATTKESSLENSKEVEEASKETSSGFIATTNRPETEATSSVSFTSATAVKRKVSKSVKTSTATKISHETEICYRGKCIRTKSENPGDDELKLLVDSASVSGLEKNKT